MNFRALLLIAACSLVVENSSAFDAPLPNQRLSRALSYPLSLPRHVLSRAVSVLGDTSRAKSFARKLLSGQPTKWAVLGGSVSTWGTRSKQQLWSRQLHAWLESVHSDGQPPSANASRVTFVDLAFPGIVPAFAERCLVQKIPPDVDLVVFELCPNDQSEGEVFASAGRRAIEAMARRVLTLPGRPALIMFCAYSIYTSSGYERFAGAEDMHLVVAQYMGIVQLLSARPIAIHLVEASSGNYSNMQALFHDVSSHANPVGHRLYADLHIAFLQSIMLQALYDRHLESQARVQDPCVQQPGSYLCKSRQALQSLASEKGIVPADHAAYRLPEPLLSSAAASSNCSIDDDLRSLASAADGFEWVDEGRNGNHKWGFVGRAANSSVDFQLSTAVGGSSVRTATVTLIYLRSYQGMGTATVRCVSGCSCRPVTIDAHWTAHASLPGLQLLPDVTRHPQCVLRVVVGKGSVSGGQKFKVVGLVLSTEGFSDQQQRDIENALKYQQTEGRYNGFTFTDGRWL